MRSFIAFATVLALAGCHRFDPQDPADRARVSRHAASRVDDALDELDATDAQRQRLAGVEKPVLEEAFRLLDGQVAAKKELWAEWASPQADAAKVHARVDERIDAARKVAHALADAVLTIHAALTAEQRAQVVEEWGPRE